MSESEVVEMSPGAQKIIDQAERQRERWQHERIGLHHYLLVLLSDYAGMAESLAADLDADRYRQQIEEQMRAGDVGEPVDPHALSEEIRAHARQQAKRQAFERDVAAVLLRRAGWTPASREPIPSPPSQAAAACGWSPRAGRPTPQLERYGRDLCREAAEGRLSPLVGRQREVQAVIETLCRRTKRNPVLVGPAGVGKTAIVEGLAQRIASNEVPAPLQGVRVIGLQPSTLIAGGGQMGEIEQRVEAILREARQDGIILFIDELHSMVGAGGMMGTGDVASLFKPALARGDLACIGATTDDEHRRFIEPDAALERRFQPIRVNELSRQDSLEVLRGLQPLLESLREVSISDPVLVQIIDRADRFLPNRYFPDKAVDILEQCVAAALTQGRAALDAALVDEVVQRMVSVPLDWERRLEALPERLQQVTSLTDDDLAVLVNRMQVTLRGVDLHPERPNAVLLVATGSQGREEGLACALAEQLFGDPERVISIDLGPLASPADISRLVGAGPQYVGYGEAVPLHRLIQMPWSVLQLGNIHRCHPQVREVVGQFLRDGVVTDGRGRHIYLSDTLVILTADLPELQAQRRPSLLRPEQAAPEADQAELRQAAARSLGEEFAALVHLVLLLKPPAGEDLKEWLRQDLLASLAQRFAAQRLVLSWDDSVVEWLFARRDRCAALQDWERLVEEQLAAEIVARLSTEGPHKGEEEKSLTVRWGEDGIQFVDPSE